MPVQTELRLFCSPLSGSAPLSVHAHGVLMDIHGNRLGKRKIIIREHYGCEERNIISVRTDVRGNYEADFVLERVGLHVVWAFYPGETPIIGTHYEPATSNEEWITVTEEVAIPPEVEAQFELRLHFFKFPWTTEARVYNGLPTIEKIVNGVMQPWGYKHVETQLNWEKSYISMFYTFGSPPVLITATALLTILKLLLVAAVIITIGIVIYWITWFDYKKKELITETKKSLTDLYLEGYLTREQFLELYQVETGEVIPTWEEALARIIKWAPWIIAGFLIIEAIKAIRRK